MIEVRVANQTLMEYAYTEENINGTTYYKNQLLEQIYGNGDKIKFEYKYDSSNLLAQLIDNVNGKTYFYNYDSLGRLISISDEDENKVSYSYDLLHGDLNKFTTSIDGQKRETNYSTDYLNGVYNKTTYKVNDSDITKEYIYDLEALQRLSGFTINVGTTEIFEETYYYDDSEVVNGYRTYRIDSVKLAKGTTTHKRIYYTYDEIGNITSITEKNSSGTIISSYSYVYDSLNQLIRENIKTANEEVSYTYEYDLYGNMLFKKEYTYTTGTLGTPINITEYVYNSSGWKDQLLEIKLNGDIIASFSYDSIGNPLSDNKYLYEWEGRQLVKLTNQSTGEIIEYRYNDAGYRTYKKVSTDINNYEEYFYYLEGDKVINEKIMHYVNNVLISTDNIYYTYDVDGTLISMNYNGNEYFYMRNLQQDIIALIDISGNIEVEYQYDAWGNIVYQTNNTLAKINSYRYRGYRFDEETKLYYLNSRYYNPEIGRFINADGLIGSTGDLLGHNMFAYCQNNPVMMVDSSGYDANVIDGPWPHQTDGGGSYGYYSGIAYVSNGYETGNGNAITIKTEIGVDNINNQITEAYDVTKEWTVGAYDDTKDWLNNDFLPWVVHDDPDRFDIENVIAHPIAVFIGVFALGSPFVATATPIPIVGEVAWGGLFVFSAGAAVVDFVIQVIDELGESYE